MGSSSENSSARSCEYIHEDTLDAGTALYIEINKMLYLHMKKSEHKIIVIDADSVWIK